MFLITIFFSFHWHSPMIGMLCFPWCFAIVIVYPVLSFFAITARILVKVLNLVQIPEYNTIPTYAIANFLVLPCLYELGRHRAFKALFKTSEKGETNRNDTEKKKKKQKENHWKITTEV